jgi:putative membrane protein
MKRASTFFTDGDRAAIEAAVACAEKRTSAEIIPVVATASGRYDRAEDVFGIVVAIAALCALWVAFPGGSIGGGWSAGGAPAFGLAGAIAAIAVGFAAGAALATRFPVLCTPFASKAEMREEVERAANEAFFAFRVRNTAEATGVLLYISLYERMVRVVGDDAIASKLGQGDWDEIRDRVIAGLAGGGAAEGLVGAIERCGELCAAHFPRAEGDGNELSNELRIID